MKVKLIKGVVVAKTAHSAGDEIELSGSDLTYVLSHGLAIEIKPAPVVKKRRRTAKRKED